VRQKIVIFICCFLAAGLRANPQEVATDSRPVTVATNLRKAVAFITVSFLKGTRLWEARGTCFFVFVPDNRLGAERGFVYAVTNRHVVQPGIENGAAYPVQKTRIRLNLKHPSNGQQSFEVEVPAGVEGKWHVPSDGSVDLAVLPFAPDRNEFDYMVVSPDLFATKDVVDDSKISEGDSVLFAGFFYNFPGQKKVQPIVREGVLAMMPDEDIETTLHKPGHLYLADVHAFGGNSGAPLFVNVGGYRNGTLTAGGFPFRLLGIVSGYYTEDENFKLTVTTTLEGKLKENSGISTVVPIDELKALLDSPELQILRNAALPRHPSNR
jgi:hypothetical protein